MDAWRKHIDVVAQTLFIVPGHLRSKWTGTVSTDGIVAHWHMEKPSKPHRKTKTLVAVRELHKRHYGTHQLDSEFSSICPLNIIAVDPGHVDLISAVRLHRTEDAVRKLQVPRSGTLSHSAIRV